MSDNDKNSENNEYEDMNYNNNINSNYNSDNNEKNERYIQTNEDKDEYILELQNKLKLKDAYITQLENDYYEKKIKCDCKDELDFIFSNAKDDRIEFLEEKISSMKKLVQELKEQIKDEISKKENKFKEKIEIMNKQNSEYQEKEKNYISKIESLSNKNKNLQIQINNYVKERITMGDIIIRQEEKLNILIERINKVEQLIKKKNKILKENEIYSIELFQIIQDQKKKIKQLKNRTIDVSYKRFNLRNSVLNNNSSLRNKQFYYNDDNEEKEYYPLTKNYDNENYLPNINSHSHRSLSYNKDYLDTFKNKKNEIENNDKIEEFKNMINQLVNEVSD